VTIYLDAVIALNFLFDIVLLMLTNYLVKGHANRLTIVLGALFASMIVPIHLYFPNSFLTSTIGKLIFSMIIVLITFRIISFFDFLKTLLTFYFVTFSIGGGLIAVYYMFEHPITAMMNDFAIHSNYGDPLSWIFVCISFPIAAYYFKKQMDRQRSEHFLSEQLYTVNIRINKQTYETKAYLDTGNQLIDPLTKRPVVICDAKFVKQWFTKDEWERLSDIHQHKDFSILPKDLSNPIHLVPYYGVSGKREWLMALKPEYLTIYTRGQKIVVKRVLIGIQFGTLSRDKRYHCLLHPQIMTQARFVS